jgi:hypothetical protein
MSYWYNASSYPGAVTVGFDSGSNLNCFNNGITNAGILYAGYVSCGAIAGPQVGSVTALQLNKWNHIAVSVKNISSGVANITIFINGRIVGSGNQTYTVASGINMMGISGQCCGRAPGIYDNIGLYSKALLASEIYQLYAEGAEEHGIALSP